MHTDHLLNLLFVVQQYGPRLPGACLALGALAALAALPLARRERTRQWALALQRARIRPNATDLEHAERARRAAEFIERSALRGYLLIGVVCAVALSVLPLLVPDAGARALYWAGLTGLSFGSGLFVLITWGNQPDGMSLVQPAGGDPAAAGSSPERHPSASTQLTSLRLGVGNRRLGWYARRSAISSVTVATPSSKLPSTTFRTGGRSNWVLGDGPLIGSVGSGGGRSGSPNRVAGS